MELRSFVKLARSLQQKKIRQEKGLFVIEGDKMVRELMLSGLKTRFLAGTEEWMNDNNSIIPGQAACLQLMPDELKKASSLSTPNLVMAVAEIPQENFSFEQIKGTFSLMMDEVQDPGNLGTIIRLADWFGIHTIICSKGTVDAYNPKVVQASMGSILRIRIYYTEAVPFLQLYKIIIKQPVYGAFIDGHSIYDNGLASKGILVMGNESAGISNDVANMVDHRISIPRVPGSGAESLNVAIATAILCAEFSRRDRE
jgi:RNA methyltransferase, TrmH family